MTNGCDEALDKQQREWEEEQERLDSESAAAEAEANAKTEHSFEPMTLKELKEKARLTDEEMLNAFGAYYGCEAVDICKVRYDEYLCAIQQDKDWQTFIQFCEENNIEQHYIVDTKSKFIKPSLVAFRSVKKVLG